MGGIVSVFTGDWKTSHKLAEVLIAPLNEDGEIDKNLGGAKVLQFWPESLAENKAPNWQNKEIPGSPIPLYQWMSGGERSLSFSAIFSRDMDGDIGTQGGPTEDKYNVDIDAAKAWLYLLSSSSYEKSQDMEVAVAPPILWLSFLGSKIGYNHAAPKLENYELDSGIYCIMTSLDFETRNWFPSGRPRLMSANLAFSETIQVGKGIYPYGRDLLIKLAGKYTRTSSGK